MQQPIEDRRSEDVIAEDLAPLTDKLVGGDEQAALLVAASDELEEEMRRSLLEGQIAELVEDEEAWAWRRKRACRRAWPSSSARESAPSSAVALVKSTE